MLNEKAVRALPTMAALLVVASVAGCDSGDDSPAGHAGTTSPPPAEVIKGFDCDQGAVSRPTAISDVDGLPGAEIRIAPTSSDCRFDLEFVDADGTTAKLSTVPGGYLLGVGGLTPNGDVLLCVSNIHHTEGSPDSSHGRRITAVTLECAVRTGKRWSKLSTIADGSGDWAAWAGDIAVAQDGSSTFRAQYVRDSTFQFLNLYDEGRPPEDGVYQTDFSLSGSSLVPKATRKVSESIVTKAPNGWLPTDEDRKAAAPYVDFD